MSQLSPEQLEQATKAAQEQMKDMTPDQMKASDNMRCFYMPVQSATPRLQWAAGETKRVPSPLQAMTEQMASSTDGGAAAAAAGAAAFAGGATFTPPTATTVDVVADAAEAEPAPGSPGSASDPELVATFFRTAQCGSATPHRAPRPTRRPGQLRRATRRRRELGVRGV